MPHENPKLGEKKRDEQTLNDMVFPWWTSVLVLAYALAVLGFTVYMDRRLPAPVGYNDDTGSGRDVFIEERARGYLKNITAFGPRPIGSKNNKVHTIPNQ